MRRLVFRKTLSTSENLSTMLTLVSDTLVTLHVVSEVTFLNEPLSTLVTIKTKISSMKLHMLAESSFLTERLVALPADEVSFSFPAGYPSLYTQEARVQFQQQ